MNDPVAVLPAVSDAMQVTVVTPIGNPEPEPGVHTTGRAPSTASTAEAVNVTTVLGPLEGCTMGAGSVRTGLTVSRTVTVNVRVPVLPAASVAVQVTVVVPSGNVAPEAGAHAAATAPLTRSVAVTVNGTTAPADEVASRTIGAGTEIDGAVVSRTVTVKAPVAVLPE